MQTQKGGFAEAGLFMMIASVAALLRGVIVVTDCNASMQVHCYIYHLASWITMKAKTGTGL